MDSPAMLKPLGLGVPGRRSTKSNRKRRYIPISRKRLIARQLCLVTKNSNRDFGPYFYGYCQVHEPSSLYKRVRPLTLADSLAAPFLALSAAVGLGNPLFHAGAVRLCFLPT